MKWSQLNSKGKKVFMSLGVITVILIAIRLILPSVVLHYANKRLSSMEGYYGYIHDIDLALIRGAYQIDSIVIDKVDADLQKRFPLFSARQIDLSIEWKSLFHGSIVGELVFAYPDLTFISERVEPEEVKKDSTDFRDLLDDFMPLKINRFEIHHGRIHFKDPQTKPPVDIKMDQVFVQALNLRNSYHSDDLLPAVVKGTAHIYEGKLQLDLRLNYLEDRPTFDLNVELNNTNLVQLNDFFDAYANIDVNKGIFGLYMEVAARDGNLNGYVKPLIKDLDVSGKEDKKDKPLRRLWEGIVGSLAKLLENPPKDQVATKIPIQGKTNEFDTNIWFALSTILRNAFIEALRPSLDYEINIESVQNESD